MPILLVQLLVHLFISYSKKSFQKVLLKREPEKLTNHKMKQLLLIGLFMVTTLIPGTLQAAKSTGTPEDTTKPEFKFLMEQFADLKIMRYRLDGFDKLTLNQKLLVYYLSEAALCGRDMTWDQNYKYNLLIRKTLENILTTYQGDKTVPGYKLFEIYAKRVFFANGIHHHYSQDKIVPASDLTQAYFSSLVKNSKGRFPLEKNETIDNFIKRITPIIFDPKIAPKKVSLDPGSDLIKSSACNFYEGVTQAEAEEFYNKMKIPGDIQPIWYGLNSKLVKEKGAIKEKIWRMNDMYSPAIKMIVMWLQKAVLVAENEQQRQSLQKLIDYYITGDLHIWDEYNKAWVNDTAAIVDVVNGFIEVYGDPLGHKATYESVVSIKDLEGTKRSKIISSNAQWFEDNSPVNAEFKKKEIKGVTAKVITVMTLGGDCYPSTPIGINLPNANWLRKEYGSKSVTMDNITYAYDQSAIGNGMLDEFCYSPEEKALSEKYGYLAGNLTTDLHECVGHGSGQLLPDVSPDAMKNYHSTIEEARADLFSLYYIYDNKLIELGLIPTLDVAKAEYNSYIRNGLMTQLVRVELGKDIEESHMRNRQLICNWVFQKGLKDNVIEKKERDGKTYFVINDYVKLRDLFGQLLAEVQRITSEGDFEAGKALVENYAVKVDPKLHMEVKERYAKLHLSPYGGFINPVFKPVETAGVISDIKFEYQDDFLKQSLFYGKKYSFLPVKN
jgi:dipeptidyl-peptidase III